MVATPIGNLGDLSPRAAEVLRTVRRGGRRGHPAHAKLFAHLGAPAPPLLSLPAFDEEGGSRRVLARLAGPATRRARAPTPARRASPTRARPLVGGGLGGGRAGGPGPRPSAALAALSASGFPADRFLFAGFLPRKGGARAEALRWLRRVPATRVLYEAGNRDRRDARATSRRRSGTGRRSLARELTKLHEELPARPLGRAGRGARGAAGGEGRGDAGDRSSRRPGRREREPRSPLEPLEDELRRRLAAGEAPSAVARDVARERAEAVGRVRRDPEIRGA